MRLIYIVGPSGAGKDSLLNRLRHDLASMHPQPPIHFAQRTITRSHHQSNENHEAVDASSFESLLKQNAFALHWSAHDLHYGVRHRELAPLSSGAWVLVNGSRAYLDEAKQRFPELTVLHVTAPVEVLRARLSSRGRETEHTIEARLNRMARFTPEPQDLSISNSGSLADSLATLKTILQQHTGIFLQ